MVGATREVKTETWSAWAVRPYPLPEGMPTCRFWLCQMVDFLHASLPLPHWGCDFIITTTTSGPTLTSSFAQCCEWVTLNHEVRVYPRFLWDRCDRPFKIRLGQTYLENLRSQKNKIPFKISRILVKWLLCKRFIQTQLAQSHRFKTITLFNLPKQCDVVN